MKSENEYDRIRKGYRKEPLTEEEHNQLKLIWRERDRKRRGTEKFKAARRLRQNNYNRRRPFWRLMKAIKKRDKSSTITASELWSIAKSQRLICSLSGRKLTNDNISPDHILPICKGGRSDKSNIRLVTKQINIMRHVVSDGDFLDLCKDVVNFNKLTQN